MNERLKLLFSMRKRSSRFIGILFWGGSLMRSHQKQQRPSLAHGFSSSKLPFFQIRQCVEHSLVNRRLPETSRMRLYSTLLKGDLNSNIYQPDVSVAVVIEQAIQDLKRIEDDQVMVSVTNILADVLELPWTTGYKDLTWIAQNKNAIPQNLQELACRLLTKQEALEFASKLHRRKQREPIQYIVGKWDFLDYTFRVRAPLLCPRPETEELVEFVAQEISGNPSIQRILDVGCGTGCIGVSLAAKFRHLQVSAIDLEPVAVKTSQENARQILGSQWSERYDAQLCCAQGLVIQRRFDMVVSNPPYIPSLDMDDLDKEVKDYESHQALSGLSVDGLDVIRHIIRRLPYWCHELATCWMEVDPSQPALLRELLASHPHVAFVSSHQDLFGKERFVKLRVHHIQE